MSTTLVTLQELRQRFPRILWTTPVHINLVDGSASGFACRICIAKYGLHADEVKDLWATEAAALAHIQTAHGAEL